MTPDEEISRLNRVIRQYETVYKTTSDGEQRARVEKQLKELKSYREKILAVNVIEEHEEEDPGEKSSSLAAFPFLQELVAREAGMQPQQRIARLCAEGETSSPAQEEVFHLMLYARWFREEILPFLTEKRLKLDFKYSLDRDGFYAKFQEVERKLDDFCEENKHATQGVGGRDMEREMRKRIIKLKRLVEADASRLFRAMHVFAKALLEDAEGDGVKCLNASEMIAFDSIEGTRDLEGKTVQEALAELSRISSEVVAFLNVPDIEGQENEGANRH